MPTNWSFEFADVELFPDKIIVRSNVDYKYLNKKYKDLLDELGDRPVQVLQDAFDKKKTQVIAFDAATRDKLEHFLSKLGEAEGVTGRVVEDKPPQAREPAPRTSTATTQGTGIVVSIQDTIDITLDHDGAVVESKHEGSAVIENKGSEKVWDVRIPVVKGDGVAMDGDAIAFPEVLPGEPREISYGREPLEGELPPLAILERVNTMPSSEVPATFFIHDPDGKGMDTSFSIELENRGEEPLRAIRVVKLLPEVFRNVDGIVASQGNASCNLPELAWTTGDLQPGEKASITFTAKAYPTEMIEYTSGEITAGYETDATAISVDEDALSISASTSVSMETIELDEEPDTWDTTVTFENKSPFPMLLRAIEVGYAGAGDDEEEPGPATTTFEPAVELQPGDSWSAEPFQVGNPGEPLGAPLVVQPATFKIIDATVLATIEARARSQLQVQAIEIPVVALDVTKKLDKVTIASFKDVPVNATVNVNVIGNAPLSRVVVQDEIPAHFLAPAPEDVHVVVGGKEIPASAFTISIEGEPDKEAGEIPPDTPRTLTITIEDPSVLEELGDGSGVTVTYPMVAHNLPKEFAISTSGVGRAWLPGSEVPVEATFGMAAAVSVVHKRRRTQIGKAIVPGAAKGDYIVTLIERNKGDDTKKDVLIADFVPEEFTILEASLDYESKKELHGTLLTWTIPEIEPNSEFEITYKVHGEGESYSLKHPEARSFK